MLSFFRSKCNLCGRKTKGYQRYELPTGEKVKVCLLCSEYAERRALKKV